MNFIDSKLSFHTRRCVTQSFIKPSFHLVVTAVAVILDDVI